MKTKRNQNTAGEIGSTNGGPSETESIGKQNPVEKKVAEDRARLHALFTQCVDSIMTLAPPDWKFTSCNPAALKLFEVPHEEAFLNLGPWELSPEKQPDGRLSSEKAPEMIDKAMTFGSHFFEWDHKTLSGKTINCNVLLSRLDVGHESYLQATVRDLTQEKLRGNLFQTVLQNVHSMIFVKDYRNDLAFSLLNKAGEDLLGVKAEQLVGKNDYDFFPKEQADFFTSKDRQVFESKTVLRIDQEAIDTPRGKRILQTYKVPTFDQNGDPHLLIGISNDITEEYQMKLNLELERAKSVKNAKLASLGEMSAGIAHEINNPLAIIAGSVSVLSRCLDNPEKIKLKIESIKKACARISKIVSGLRKFSRSGEKSNLSPFSLNSIVKEVLVLTENKSRRHDTPITLNEKSESIILCDEIEIEQVLVNLIVNAIDAVKATSDRWVNVSIHEDQGIVILRITDSGPGIPENIRERLFEPFFTTKKVGEGTGLGLSISKGILDEHKAAIKIIPDCPNTCFEIRFKAFEGPKTDPPNETLE
jgi:PAS domain S-box-containing protein